MATPFDHNGDLYRAKLKHNVEKWNLTGLSGYVVCGSTGESVLLSPDEKLKRLVAEYAAPYSTITIWEAHRTRDTEAGLDWQNRIRHAAHLVTAKYGIPGLKYAMDLNGYYGGPCRLPLAPPTSEAKQEIEEAFRDLRG